MVNKPLIVSLSKAGYFGGALEASVVALRSPFFPSVLALLEDEKSHGNIWFTLG